MKEDRLNSLQQKFARKSEDQNENSARDSRINDRQYNRRSDTILSSDDFTIEGNSIEYKPQRRFNNRQSDTQRRERNYTERRRDDDFRDSYQHGDRNRERYGKPQRDDNEQGARRSWSGSNDRRGGRRYDDDSSSERRDSRFERKSYQGEGGRRERSSYGEKPYGEKKFGKGKFQRSERNEYGYNNDYTERRRKPGKPFAKRGQEQKPQQTVDDGTIRLNKYIADAGYCSRREADNLITAGCVKVNNEIITTLGTKINKTDKVQIGEETLHNEKLKYLLLNKPKGYITTMDDPQKRNTVLQLIDNACKERLFPVGRLDRNTSGLLLFTNDGEMANKLMHPRGNVSKVYHVVLDKPLTKADMQAIADGLELEDGFIAVDSIAYSDMESKKEVGVEIHSGRNHIVRRIFSHLGYEVVKLDRTLYAGLTKKDLPRGRWRFLSQNEINYLRMI